jgi:hypothetical protein
VARLGRLGRGLHGDHPRRGRHPVVTPLRTSSAGLWSRRRAGRRLLRKQGQHAWEEQLLAFYTSRLETAAPKLYNKTLV